MSSTSTTCRERPRAAALILLVATAAAATTGTGCRAVRGRKMIQDANELYRHGRYREAVALFTEAEGLVPELPVLWLNKGYTCRQLLVPGAGSDESRQAAACALQAFTRLKDLRPADPRGDQLYIQTLSDADDLPALERLFTERSQQHPDDLEAVRGLQQVYYKSGQWPAALQWSRKAAALRPEDAETQYGVGTFIWQLLSSRGGGAEMVAFDPRPKLVENEEGDDEEASAARPGPKGKRRGKADTEPKLEAPTPPPTAPTDISGPLRVELANEGIRYLERALALRPHYPEAMTYLALLERQKSFAFFAELEKWQAAVDRARGWQEKAVAARAGGKP
jgi:tetratricopeptide (TPR) repeat protein